MKEIEIKIKVDTRELDEAMAKVRALITMLERAADFGRNDA